MFDLFWNFGQHTGWLWSLARFLQAKDCLTKSRPTRTTFRFRTIWWDKNPKEIRSGPEVFAKPQPHAAPCSPCRNFVESAEVADGLLRVRHHPAMEDKMQKLHSGHQDQRLCHVLAEVFSNKLGKLFHVSLILHGKERPRALCSSMSSNYKCK